MRKLLFMICVFCALQANAQNYLINFAGSGAATTVSTVKVENLTKSTSININGSDVLHLTIATGVNPVEDNKSSGLKVYPNPMTDNSTLELFPPVEGNAVITILDMTGKQVGRIQRHLENTRQAFKLTGLKKGFYVINVTGTNYRFSEKLLSNGKSNGTVSVEMVNNISRVEDDVKAEKNASKGTLATIEMAYTTGDRLKFTGTSGNYTTIKMDIPASDKTITFNFSSCNDGDNNNYPVVEIGTQLWMAENLKTTLYRNHSAITNVTSNTLWSALSTPAYCWYNNNGPTYKPLYGAIYNWFAVNTGNLCPTDWHVPSDAEFQTLETYLGMAPAQLDLWGWRGTDQGARLKNTTGWNAGGNGTNATGFTALPGGYRYAADGSFNDVGDLTYWWTTLVDGATTAWYRRLDGTNSDVYRASTERRAGKYVRCVHD